jgi:hypothetical protein
MGPLVRLPATSPPFPLVAFPLYKPDALPGDRITQVIDARRQLADIYFLLPGGERHAPQQLPLVVQQAQVGLGGAGYHERG